MTPLPSPSPQRGREQAKFAARNDPSPPNRLCAFLLPSYFRHERTILGVTAAVILLLVWEGFGRGWWADLLHPLLGQSSEALRLKPIFVSSPSAVADSAWSLFVVTGAIWPHLAWSGLELALGLALSIVIGVPLGLICGRYPLLSHAVTPFVSALNATPQIALLPLIILWVGTGLAARVLVIFLLTVLPLFINCHAAVRTTDPRLMTVARSFAASEWFTFRSIIVPTAIPFLLAGLRLAIGRGMIGIVVGELTGAPRGVGFMINRAGALFETDVVFVGILTLVATGLILTGAVRRMELALSAWRAPLAP
jgi:NitT/TauT family transport system permease protein